MNTRPGWIPSRRRWTRCWCSVDFSGNTTSVDEVLHNRSIHQPQGFDLNDGNAWPLWIDRFLPCHTNTKLFMA